LLFRKFKIKLQDYLIEEFCKIISTLSEMALGQKVALKIESLLTIDKIEELKQWKKTGQSDLKTISEAL